MSAYTKDGLVKELYECRYVRNEAIRLPVSRDRVTVHNASDARNYSFTRKLSFLGARKATISRCLGLWVKNEEGVPCSG